MHGPGTRHLHLSDKQKLLLHDYLKSVLEQLGPDTWWYKNGDTDKEVAARMGSTHGGTEWTEGNVGGYRRRVFGPKLRQQAYTSLASDVSQEDALTAKIEALTKNVTELYDWATSKGYVGARPV